MSNQIRREVVFSARDNGTESTIARIRESANQLGRELIDHATRTGLSAKDTVKYYEDQVKAIEKVNRATEKSRRSDLNKQFTAAERRGDPIKLEGPSRATSDEARLNELLNPKTQEYRDQLQNIEEESKEDQIQIDLLRELIETVKRSSEREVRQDNKNSIRETSSYDRQVLSEAGPQFQDLANRFNDKPSSSDSDKKEQSRYADFVSAIRGVTGSSNAAEAASAASSGMLGKMNPIAMTIAAITGVGTLSLQNRASREMAAGSFAALSGQRAEDVVDSGMGATNLGEYGPSSLNVNREEFLSKYLPQAIKSAGTAESAEERTMRQIEMDKGFGLDEGTSSRLESLIRVSGESSAQTLGAKIFSSLSGTGALGEGDNDMTNMNKYIQGFISLQERQLMRSGATESQGTLGAMRSLRQLGGNFEREDYVMDTVERLNSGLSDAGSPEAKAIKFDILRRQNPGKSHFELQTEMEKGVNSQGFLSGVFDFVKNTGGDINAQSLLMDQLTGGQMRKSDITSILSGKTSLDEIDEIQALQDPNIQSRARRASSSAGTQLEFTKEAMKDGMEKMGKWMSELIGVSKETNSKLGNLENYVKTLDRF